MLKINFGKFRKKLGFSYEAFSFTIIYSDKIVESCLNLKSISLPDGLRSIRKQAFAYCRNLKTVTLPDSVSSINDGAFMECDSLVEIVVPDNVESLYNTFTGCDSLKNVTLPKSLKYVDDTFAGCVSLESIEIPEGITHTHSFGFKGCTGLKRVKLPDSMVTVTGFEGCVSLEEINIPEGVHIIGGFKDCHSLKKIDLPSSLMEIYENTFVNCYSLEEITIPAVDELGDGIFRNCTGLKRVVYPVSEYWEITNNMFTGCTSLEEVILPDTITSIEPQAFMDCTSLKQITIPKCVYSDFGFLIYWEAFKGCTSLETLTILGECGIQRSAFENCTGLKKINFPDDEEIYLDTYAFANCSSLETLEFTEYIDATGFGVFNNCDSLAKVVIPETLKVGNNCFSECDNLQEVEIHNPSALTYYNSKYAFENCVNLKRVYLWFENTYCIPQGTFKGCNNLETVYFLGSEENWEKVRIDAENEPLEKAQILFDGVRAEGSLVDANAAGEGITWRVDRYYNLVLSGTGETADFDSWKDQPWDVFRSQIQSIVVEDGVTVIGRHIFENLPGVKDVHLPGSLFYIDEYAFNQCKSLKTVHFRGSVKAWNRVIIGNFNAPIENADIRAVAIDDYTDNKNIRINSSGSAIAYFKSNQGDVSVVYRINGYQNIVHCDENGIFAIPLHHKVNTETEIKQETAEVKAEDRVFAYDPNGSNVHKISIYVCQVDDVTFWDDPVPMDVTVTVTPLTFAQSWTMSFDKTITAGIKKGIGGQVGPVEMEATLIGAEVGVIDGSTLHVRREYLEGRETLEITSDLRMGMGLEVNSGITGDLLIVEPDVYDMKGGASVVNSGTFGLKISNYSIGDSEQQRAIALFLLSEQLMAASNNQILQSICKQLRDKHVYEVFLDKEKLADGDLGLISGVSTAFSANASADLFGISVQGESLFGSSDVEDPSMDLGSVVGGETKGVTTYGFRDYSSDRKESFVSYLMTKEFKAFTDITSNSLFSKDFMGKDIKITFLKNKNPRNVSLEAMTRRYEADGSGTQKYDVYSLDYDALQKLMAENAGFKKYYEGEKLCLSKKDIIGVADYISGNGNKTPYKSVSKTEEVKSIQLGLGATIFVELGLEVEAAWKETLEYDAASGFVNGNEHMPTNISTDQSGNLQGKKKGILGYLHKCAEVGP